MGKPQVPIDWQTCTRMRFISTVRRTAWSGTSYCVGCGEVVPEHEGPWVYNMRTLDQTLCEACGDRYAPEVMREIRKYYEYMRIHPGKR